MAGSANEIARLVSVSKRFKDSDALVDFTIGVEAQKITALLGPNGAGKTTAIRVLTGAIEPDGGQALVFGLDPTGPHGGSVRARCGVVSAKPALYDRLSGLDNLRYAADLYKVPSNKRDQRIKSSAALFKIEDALDQKVGGYSTGMKTRLALARSVLHEPELLILDEPTSGLDPESAQAVLELVRTLPDEGKTVLMCTHLLLEADGLADNVAVVEHGKILASGKLASLTSDYCKERETTISVSDETANNLDLLANYQTVKTYTRFRNEATITLYKETEISRVIASLVQAGSEIQSVVPNQHSLEDLYFAVVSKSRTGDAEQTQTPAMT